MAVEGVTQESVLRWLSDGRRVAAATLVEVVGSAPLEPGATMVVDEHGNIEGSVTGGCVEGALVEEAQRVLSGGAPRINTYGISDELAGAVGLTCGGTVRILVAALEGDSATVMTETLTAVHEGRPAAIATVLDGPSIGHRLALVDERVVGSLGVSELLDRSVARDAGGLLAQGVSMVRRYGSDGATMGDELRVYIQSFAQPPRMVIFGAIDFSAALAVLAKEFGYLVTICDARQPFLASRRFSQAAEVVDQWPDEYMKGRQLGPRDSVLVFTHDPKFDLPALVAALRTGAGYIGALGSRRTQQDRRRRLSEAGVTDAELDRIVAPCGLDIGAATPTETAISVLAEIIALRAGRKGDRLVDTEGPIRPRPGADTPR